MTDVAFVPWRTRLALFVSLIAAVGAGHELTVGNGLRAVPRASQEDDLQNVRSPAFRRSAPPLGKPPEGGTTNVNWGSDHVGKPVPHFMSGDECLFCHRNDIGPTWPMNRHGRTIRPVDPETESITSLLKSAILKGSASQIEFVIGGTNRERFLKRGREHGRLELLSLEWIPPRPEASGRIVGDPPQWDADKFGKECAGCHTSGIDTKTTAFTALSLDCFVCHGEIPDKHTTEPALAHFSKKRKEEARVTVSICAQCHIRTGTAKSTGRPYPNNFVAGDNLFRDFQVDFSEEQLTRLNPADAHILHNVRDVIVHGQDQITCLSCHNVHKKSGTKHQRIAGSSLCHHCHDTTSRKKRIAYEVHSRRCGY